MKICLFRWITVASLMMMESAHSLTKTEFEAATEKLVQQRKLAYEKCASLARPAQRVCVIEANGREDIARGELDAIYKPGPRADMKVRLKRAEIAYDIAKLRCDELQSAQKRLCHKDAKAAYDSAKAAAKAKLNSAGERASVQVQCDALIGDAKAACINPAKPTFARK